AVRLKPDRGDSIDLSPEEKAILGKCKGRRTARQIALEMFCAATHGSLYEEDVFRILESFAAQKIITWTLEVPVVLHPERALRDLLERVEDEPLRTPSLASLNQLEQARDRVAQAFQQAYEELAAKSQSATIEMLAFWVKIRRLFTNPGSKLFDQLVPEFQRRWAEVLRIPDARRVEYTTADLQSRVAAAFDAPQAGWRQARHHSPDVMISAASVEDIRRGNYQLVLGEVHMASNTLRPSWAMAQHPYPEEMFDAIDHDFPEEQVFLVPPKSFRRYSGRARFTLTSARNYLIEVKEDSLSWHPPSKTLPITAFVVEPGPEGLTARTKDDRLRFDLIEFFGEALSNESVEYMDPIGHSPHVPRITVDRLVIQRESWSFPASDLQ